MPPIDQSEAEAAILSAKKLFWHNGYEDTSVEALVQATGFNRYALYNTFGGKLELFLVVLEGYYEERRSLFLTALEDPTRGPLDAIREVSEFCITEMVKSGAGCLMCNVALEVGHYDKVVSERVTQYLNEIQSAKEMTLMLAAKRGELNPLITPKQGAAMLMSNMLGGGVLAKNGASRKDIIANFNNLISLLKVPENLSQETGTTTKINRSKTKTRKQKTRL